MQDWGWALSFKKEWGDILEKIQGEG